MPELYSLQDVKISLERINEIRQISGEDTPASTGQAIDSPEKGITFIQQNYLFILFVSLSLVLVQKCLSIHFLLHIRSTVIIGVTLYLHASAWRLAAHTVGLKVVFANHSALSFC